MDVWRNAASVALAFPSNAAASAAVSTSFAAPSPPTAAAAAPRRPGGSLPMTRELIRSHVALLWGFFSSSSSSSSSSVLSPPVALQLSSMMALGHVHPEHYEVLMDEVRLKPGGGS